MSRTKPDSNLRTHSQLPSRISLLRLLSCSSNNRSKAPSPHLKQLLSKAVSSKTRRHNRQLRKTSHKRSPNKAANNKRNRANSLSHSNSNSR